MLHVTDVRLVGGYHLWLRFNDGTAGEIDLGAELEGPLFAPEFLRALLERHGPRNPTQLQDSAPAGPR
ncbi:MAG: hypothetical protein IBJ03_06395 [Gemmatimonadaceae bacterium]|nr:hypothetical protein [Gemmatimonadaceae bacterium]